MSVRRVREQFNLLLLDEGEYYFDDVVAVHREMGKDGSRYSVAGVSCHCPHVPCFCCCGGCCCCCPVPLVSCCFRCRLRMFFFLVLSVAAAPVAVVPHFVAWRVTCSLLSSFVCVCLYPYSVRPSLPTLTLCENRHPPRVNAYQSIHAQHAHHQHPCVTNLMRVPSSMLVMWVL